MSNIDFWNVVDPKQKVKAKGSYNLQEKKFQAWGYVD